MGTSPGLSLQPPLLRELQEQRESLLGQIPKGILAFPGLLPLWQLGASGFAVCSHLSLQHRRVPSKTQFPLTQELSPECRVNTALGKCQESHMDLRKPSLQQVCLEKALAG